MNYSSLRFLFQALITLILVVIFNSSALSEGSVKSKSTNESEREQQQFNYKQNKGGPPALAPLQGDRAKHQYRYYPTQNVYYDTDRGLYFYPKGDNWEVGTSLPSRLKAGLAESITIKLDTDKPYVHNEDHLKKHTSKKSVKSEKNMWSKLLFVLLYAHASK